MNVFVFKMKTNKMSDFHVQTLTASNIEVVPVLILSFISLLPKCQGRKMAKYNLVQALF